MPDTEWTHETAGEVTTNTTTSSPTTTWTNENVGDGETTTTTSTPEGTTTQEIVGSSGTATTTSSPTTTWTTETIGAHIAGESLTIDDIKIDENNIGHINDTDLLTLGIELLLIKGNTYIRPEFSLLTDTIRSYTPPSSIAMNLDGANVEVVGDLTITGGNIRNAITCDSTLTVTGVLNANARMIVNGDYLILADGSILNILDDTEASSNDGGSGALRCTGGASIAKKLYVGTDLDVDGTINADNVDIDGPLQLDATLTVGVNDTGYDVKFYGATSGQYMLWDESQDCLELAGDSKLFFHDQGDEYIQATADGELKLASGYRTTYLTAYQHEFFGNIECKDNLEVGSDAGGELFKAYGDTAGAFFSYNNTPLSSGLHATRANDIDLWGGDMRIKNISVGTFIDINSITQPSEISGPNLRLLRGDIDVGQVGIAGKLGEIKFDGMAADGTLAREPFGRILVRSLGVVKDYERGGIYIDGNVLGRSANAFKAVPYEDAHSDGNGGANPISVHLDINIGHDISSRITMNGIVKCGGNIIQDAAANDIIKMGGISDEGEANEAEINNLRVTDDCRGDFTFPENGQLIDMTGDNQVIRMSGYTPKINIGGEEPEIAIGDSASDVDGGGGLLTVKWGYGNTSADKPGIINLQKKATGAVGGGNAYLWVDGDMKLRIDGTAPTGLNYNTWGTIVGNQS